MSESEDWAPLAKATTEDLRMSLETDGRPTDHHRVLASKIFGVPYYAVTPHQRQRAKQTHFRQGYYGFYTGM